MLTDKRNNWKKSIGGLYNKIEEVKRKKEDNELEKKFDEKLRKVEKKNIINKIIDWIIKIINIFIHFLLR